MGVQTTSAYKFLDEEHQTQSISNIIKQEVNRLIPESSKQDKVVAEAFLQTVSNYGIQIIINGGKNDEIVIPPKESAADPSQEPGEPLFTLYIKDLLDLVRTLRRTGEHCERIHGSNLLAPSCIKDYQLASLGVDNLQIANVSLPLIVLQALSNASLNDLIDSEAFKKLIQRTSEHMEGALRFVGLEPVEVGKFEVKLGGLQYKCSILFGIKFHDIGYESPASFNFHLVPREALAVAERWNRVVTHIRRLTESLPEGMRNHLPYLLLEVDMKDVVDSWGLPAVYVGTASGTSGEEAWIYGVQDRQAQTKKRGLLPELKIASQLKNFFVDWKPKIQELIVKQRSAIWEAVKSSAYLTEKVPPDLIGQLQNPDYKARDIFDSEAGLYWRELKKMREMGVILKKEEKLLTTMENLLMLEEALELSETLPPSVDLLIRLRKKIDRFLYKMDRELPHITPVEASDFQTTPDENYDSSYNPEHFLKDIPKPHFASLVLAISALHGNGIRRVHIIPFKPVRYLSHELSELNHHNVRAAQEIEKSTTDSFIMMTYRLPEQIEGVRISLGEDDVIGMGEIQIELGNNLISTNPTIQLLIDAGTKSTQIHTQQPTAPNHLYGSVRP